jgi:6-methylsalicylate decarboxylase
LKNNQVEIKKALGDDFLPQAIDPCRRRNEMIVPSEFRGHVRPCLCCDSFPDPYAVTRRGFVKSASALGLFAAMGAGLVPSAHAQARPRRIDVHHHISPPSFLDAVKKAKLDNPPMMGWSPQKSIDDMEKGGVATSITSPTTPQVGFLAKEEAARVARESNEYAKRLMSDHPGRFGVFAMLPMPYIDESLNEIEYALDVLKADGIGMMTSYGDKWLGYPVFAPVFEELNRRKATVYTHPTGADCCVNLVQGIPPATIEYGTDTTRTIVNLIFSGASQRFKDINFIFSHSGGVLTAVAERLQIQMVSSPPYQGKFTREDVEGEMRRFYYDTAQVANAVTIGALARLVPVSQIVFGSDYPYRTTAEHTRGLALAFSGDNLKAIERENALRLLPRLKSA